MKIKRSYLFLSIPLFVLLLAAYLFGPKLASAKTTIWNPPFKWQPKLVSQSPDVSVPDVAYGNGKFGVVWNDKKDGSYEIFFGILDVLGNKIGNDLRITNDLGNSMDPVVAFNGNDFGIFWYDNPSGSNRGIYYARISVKGKLLQTPIRINREEADGVHPSTIWNPKTDEYAVTWCDTSLGNGAYFARVNRKGNRLMEFPVSTLGPTGYYRTLIAKSKKEYALTWTQWVPCGTGSCPETAFARVDFAGKKIGDDRVITNYGATRPLTITWNGSNWGSLVGIGHYAKLLNISREGVVLGSPIDLGDVMMSNARMVWSGKEYGISWGSSQWVTPENPGNGEVVFRKFDLLGSPLSDVIRITENETPSWSLSTPIVVGKRFALVWVDNLYEPDQAIFFAQGK